LVVLTILKNISQWEGLSHIPVLWNVPNHQPDITSWPTKSGDVRLQNAGHPSATRETMRMGNSDHPHGVLIL
jgi:hypothetical protein